MRTMTRWFTVGALSLGSIAVATGAASPASAIDLATFHGQTPARLLDTRPGSPTIDGAGAGGGAIASLGTVNATVIGRGGVPATGVGAVALNVTVTGAAVAGFLTVYPNAVARPTASNLNFTAGQTIPNMVVVPVGAAGQVTLFNGSGGTINAVVDVLGWFPIGPAFSGLTPARLVDTRAGSPTVDGAGSGSGAIPGNTAASFTLIGRGGLPASGIGAVAINLTATGATASGFLTAFPSGVVRPTASNVNFTAGQTVPNMVIVPLGADGKLSVFNGGGGSTNVVVDVLGWFPTGASFTGLNPSRLLDTRVGSPTIDSKFSGNGVLTEGSTLNVVVGGRGGVPLLGAGSVAVNVTVTNPTIPGFLTISPQGSLRPTASNLNFAARRTVANMVLVPLGGGGTGGGQISIFLSGGTADVVVDVLGWFPNPTSPPTFYGNNLVLRSNGIGSALWGSTPAATLALLAPVLGSPTSDVSQYFNVDEGGGWFANSASGDSFRRRYGRQVCFGQGPCVVFGGAASASGFLGWYYSGSDARLIDSNGLGVSNRGSDFPGAIAAIDDGGCYTYGGGSSATGIRVDLFAPTGFSTVDGDGNFVSLRPTQSQVFVVGLQSGDLIYGESGDC